MNLPSQPSGEVLNTLLGEDEDLLLLHLSRMMIFVVRSWRISRDLQGLSLTVRDLGVPEQPRVRFSILPTTRSGRYLLLQPNDVVTREINKVNFQIIKYQKLTSYILMTLVVVSTGHAPLATLEIELMDRLPGLGLHSSPASK